jgi:hypothetical protein
MAIAAGVRLRTGSTVVASPIRDVTCGDLREQHDRVVPPPLGGAEPGVAELLGTRGESDRRVALLVRRPPRAPWFRRLRAALSLAAGAVAAPASKAGVAAGAAAEPVVAGAAEQAVAP